MRGYVIDFVDWHLNDPDWTAPLRHWFTFNVADVGITAGVCLILLDGLLTSREAKRAQAGKPMTGNNGAA
jgi:lipoprotein signal peptidase